MTKPGVTFLMKAAAEADLSAIKEILISADDVDATDGSGWTALMYAAASGHSEPVELLLAAKANPNHKSLNGDTPLMASAISRLFDQNLAHSGAALNAKNSVGTTVLMILAAAGEADEVRDALKAGADAPSRIQRDVLHSTICASQTVARVLFPDTVHSRLVRSATSWTKMTFEKSPHC
jgi:ankyrin repeat protein